MERAINPKQAIVVSCIIWFCIMASIFFLSKYGASRRVYSPTHSSVAISEPSDAYTVWADHNVRGRILVLFDRKLNAEPNDETLSSSNYVYIAIRRDLVRKVFHVIADVSWPEVEQSLAGREYFRRVGNEYHITIDGSMISILRLKDLPAIEEPVLVNINGSLWEKNDMRILRRLLLKNQLTSDIVTISGLRAQDLLAELNNP